ncbi:MAG: radical SAM protein [Deltaproteobacteria bacterium]|nr:radical SAM protein [Deltaproteobacteria bacterium]
MNRLWRARELWDHGMPRNLWAVRAVIAGQVARRALHRLRDGGGLAHTTGEALGEAVLLELATRGLGAESFIRLRQGFFPHIFTPDYHGPHFSEAMRRALLPGRGPNIVYFSLTGTCPCHCAYCFAGAGAENTSRLEAGAVRDVARALAEERVPLVNISGGEPLTRYPLLLEVTRILRAGSEVRLFTTGIGLTEPRLDALLEAGLKGIFVSLDTEDAVQFDRVRGRAGAFSAATTALGLAARRGALTFANCVVSRSAFSSEEEIARFLAFVEAIDPRIVVNFLPQLATGRGTEADSFASPEECEQVAQRIVAVAAERGRPVGMLFGPIDTFLGCVGAGGKLLNIDVAGNVTVCISRAALGNVLEEPFSVIYRRFVERCARLKVGFFCCRVGEAGCGEALSPDASRRALDQFFESMPDAQWQKVVDRYGWILSRLYHE